MMQDIRRSRANTRRRARPPAWAQRAAPPFCFALRPAAWIRLTCLGRAHATLESRRPLTQCSRQPRRPPFASTSPSRYRASCALVASSLMAAGGPFSALKPIFSAPRANPNPIESSWCPSKRADRCCGGSPEGLGNVQALGVDQVIGVVLDADNPELGSGIELIQAPQCAEPL